MYKRERESMMLSYVSQRTTRWSPLAPAVLWILGIKLPDLLVDAFALYSILLTLTSFLRQGLSLHPKLTDSARPAGHRACLHLPRAAITGSCCQSWLFPWDSELRSSHLQSKNFIHQVVSPEQVPNFFHSTKGGLVPTSSHHFPCPFSTSNN